MFAWSQAAKTVTGSTYRQQRRRHAQSLIVWITSLISSAGIAHASTPAETPRIIHADVVALDHMLVYNRFGSFNPFGMIYALRRDVTAAGNAERPTADRCAEQTGAEAGNGKLEPGEVRLRDCKRPRPLVLRANAGDILEVTFTNLLRKDQPGISGSFSEEKKAKNDSGFCEEQPAKDGSAIAPIRQDVRTAFGEEQCRKAAETEADEAQAGSKPGTDWPLTRGLSFVIPGIEPIPVRHGKTSQIHGACTGLDAIRPGQTVTCRWQLLREGTHLFSSLAAPAGGEGDAGSLGHGLFGALIVEPAGSRAFRSQVNRTAFERAWPSRQDSVRHARSDAIDFNLTVPDSETPARVTPPLNSTVFWCIDKPTVPVLAVRRSCDARNGAIVEEIIHGDLNAIVVPSGAELPPIGPTTSESDRRKWRQMHEAQTPFREFTIIFHDELKTFYADELKQLGSFGQLSGVRDGFAINYGSSGLGSALLSNRLGIGPAANCPECMYEEFFLESWANGDPALLEVFPDDPSNVYHSYLNDKVVFRNFHAGKETHVFHLHSHQWFAGNDAGRGAYLDSQTIGPQQGFSYRIYHGGLERFAMDRAGSAVPKGWWDSLGSGNRNRTPGDAIFHCHLYPHFAQGMWSLWRVHDVLEDGTRVLPDGQREARLSVIADPEKGKARPGSVGRAGEWLDPAAAADGKVSSLGTPIPGLIPLPGQGLPLLPTYSDPVATAALAPADPINTDSMPGYPFYVAGKPGHRSPQPPLDMARAEKHEPAGIGDAQIAALEGRAHFDGGLPRHIVAGGVALPTVLKDLTAEKRAEVVDKKGVLARMLALGDMTSEYEHLNLELLPQQGTALERNAMAFHGTGSGVRVVDATGREPAQRTVTLQGDPAAPAPPPLETRLDPDSAAYRVKAISLDNVRSGPTGGAASLVDDARFAVNGSPGAPGAPFADPCSAPLVLAREGGPRLRRFDAFRSTWQQEPEPFRFQTDAFGNPGVMTPDPALIGFRRFDVSAVELKLIVNRAGWHDPQARINVLSAVADDYKGRWRSDAEPFFFRAFSGECIEYHHTNETPKKLKLDDFQTSVPTDIIGQHIHLVKFDVTSSDGSGNGFNYEDGTFAPDEVLERICKSRTVAGGSVAPRPGEAVGETVAARSDEECAADFIGKVPTLPRLTGNNIKYFQTTIQRWFADPILSDNGENGLAGVTDRTMRTVFSHDHFGPSNIQQHGFYTALLIEPPTHAVCPLAEANSTTHEGKNCQSGPAAATQPVFPFKLAQAAQRDLVGVRANVFLPRPDVTADGVSGDPVHVDSREYAIAIADFALLYDGNKTAAAPTTPEESGGIDRLILEATTSNTPPNAEDEAEETAPANFLRERHLTPSSGDVEKLRQRLNDMRTAYGRPVAPPPRPEAISQRHHDPYLVNYRNEPVPLRVGATANGAPPSFLSNPCRLPGPQDASFASGGSDDSIVRQRPLDDKGDLSQLFLSRVHGDPCTPILEGLAGDRIVARLIQGAQEVQHTLVVEGRPGRRNVDQPFPSERPLGTDAQGSLVSRAARCASGDAARAGRPRAFPKWATIGLSDPAWDQFDRLVAGCDNPLGFVSAQEIGISEHFEVGSLFASGTSVFAPLRRREPSGGTVSFSARPADSHGRPSLDYLYHFGSTDAVWNGAWGLVRSYDSSASPDLSACLGKAPSSSDFAACVAGQGQHPIGDRIETFAALRQRVGGASPAAEPAQQDVVEALSPTASRVRSWCPAGAPRIEAIAVAVRAGKVLDKSTINLPGTVVDKAGLFDRDGLLLVPLEPRDLGLSKPLMDYENDSALPKSIAQIQTIAAAKLKKAGDNTGSPFVLRVRAGDCLDLMVINALPGQGDPWDAHGDAPMPKIVPLNVDSDERQYGGSKTFAEWASQSPRFRGQITPSRRVSLSLPLPSPMLKPGGTLPVGVNDVEAIAPDGAGSPVFRVTRHYAGFLWPEDTAIMDLAREPAFWNSIKDRVEAHIPSRLTFRLLSDTPCGAEQQIVIYGVNLCIHARNQNDDTVPIPQEKQDAVRRIAQDGADLYFTRDEVRKKAMRAIPYAFGTLPIRSVGDVIAHGSQGLIGTLIVEPTALGNDGAPAGESPARDFSYRHAATVAVAAPAIPQASIPAGSFREHVLLWQDGLNHWRRAPGGSGYLGMSGRPVPDCRICDDSYDLGEKGVSNRSAPFNLRVAGRNGVRADFGLRTYPRDEDDLNTVRFPPDFFAGSIPTPRLDVRPADEIAIRVAHPEGRARQRAFLSMTTGYDDLFPGFGSGHATLLAPAKAMTAWGCAPRTAGDYLWRDGPQPIFAAGVWGHLHVSASAAGGATSCSLPGID